MEGGGMLTWCITRKEGKFDGASYIWQTPDNINVFTPVFGVQSNLKLKFKFHILFLPLKAQNPMLPCHVT